MMWWLFVVIVAVVFYFVLKYQNLHGHITHLAVLSLLLFFVLSVWYVYSTNSPNLNTLDGVVAFMKVYGTWISAVFSNTNGAVGYIVHQNWTGNSTISG